MQPTSTVVLIILALSPITAQFRHFRYVMADGFTLYPSFCARVPCRTFNQYVQQTTRYFTPGSTFLFLPGNHTVRATLQLPISNVVLTKKERNSDVYIICSGIDSAISLQSVDHIHIEGLAFILHNRYLLQTISALKVRHSRDIHISSSSFKGKLNLGVISVRAIFLSDSVVTITGCQFEGNTGDNGGALYQSFGTTNIHDSIFSENQALHGGGAIFVSNGEVVIHDSTFLRNRAMKCGGAIHISSSSLSLGGTYNLINENSAENGGGMCIRRVDSEHTLLITIANSSTKHLNFTQNIANSSGGAIYAQRCSLFLGTTAKNTHYFANNLGERGGAIYHESVGSATHLLQITGRSHFFNNSAVTLSNNVSKGGAIHVFHNKVFFSGFAWFTNNKALQGGAIYMELSRAFLTAKSSITFIENFAEEAGGGIFASFSSMTTHNNTQLIFFCNKALGSGGAYYITGNLPNTHKEVVIGDYIGNEAGVCGGAIYLDIGANVSFKNINATNNSGSALCSYSELEIIFSGLTIINNNTGQFGGGMHLKNSFLTFTDNATFAYNKASVGGAIYSIYRTILHFNGDTFLKQNTADEDGGAIYALNTDITVKGVAQFMFNSAQNGGAIYANSATSLRVESLSALSTAHNYATKYGGGIFIQDIPTPAQCHFETASNKEIANLPFCFIHLGGSIWTGTELSINIEINSYRDIAGLNGSFLYGGLLDRCQLQIRTLSFQTNFLSYNYLDRVLNLHEANNTNAMSSSPYQLCFCEGTDCFQNKNQVVHRGQTFNVALKAYNQFRTSISTVVTAKTSKRANLMLNQSTQVLMINCASLSYNIYSSFQQEQIILYPQGPCHDTGQARATINVTLLPCPNGFVQSSERCVCEERLQAYNATCLIGEEIYILREASSKFWLNATYNNGLYQGLILFSTCPLDYCKNTYVNLTLDNPDVQCANHRSGLLCGACASNHSFMLGSSYCEECSNIYLLLLIPFTVAGIALVFFLSILRLTVATGTMNSLILYANIIQANKDMFLKVNKVNILTIFLSWMNLDFGFVTCFYNGMTAYAQTWLQFVFPIYVWVLISIVIVTSRYSLTVSKLIGHNPVAVLATLLLMSYTKILRIIVDVFSFVYLDYPQNEKVPVWLKDANVPYLQSSHLYLALVTSLVLIFFFLPYTFLLLLGYKLYPLSDKKCFIWLNRIKPLLDAYYAPYKFHTRYWTGFLLLIRCALYVVFSFNTVKITSVILTLVLTAIVTKAWLLGRIYESLYIDVIESSVYLNLIALSSVTLANYNSAVLVYCLIGTVFATLISIIIFQVLHITKITQLFKRRHPQNCLHEESVRANSCENTSTQAPITTTFIELREPLLDN